MPSLRLLFHAVALLAALLATTGCSYHTAVQRLSPSEQTEFRIYSKAMTSAQARTYLAKATPTERTAYLHDIGLAQRFQALTSLDREALLAGHPHHGMSAAALRFLWGSPYYTEGRANYYEHWYYLGSSLALATTGHGYRASGNRVVVFLDNGRVTSWLDFVPTNDDDSSDEDWGQ